MNNVEIITNALSVMIVDGITHEGMMTLTAASNRLLKQGSGVSWDEFENILDSVDFAAPNKMVRNVDEITAFFSRMRNKGKLADLFDDVTAIEQADIIASFYKVCNFIKDECYTPTGEYTPAQIKKDYTDGLLSATQAKKEFDLWLIA